MTCAKCGHPIEMTSVGRYGTRDHMQRGCPHRPAPQGAADTVRETSARRLAQSWIDHRMPYRAGQL